VNNFAFLPNRFSEIAAAATKAEGHIQGDLRTACFHARVNGLAYPSGCDKRRL